MNLLTAAAGQTYRVIRLDGGGDFRTRLANLGIAEGAQLAVAHRHPFRGPVTVRVKGSEVAIGHGMAKRIAVEEIE